MTHTPENDQEVKPDTPSLVPTSGPLAKILRQAVAERATDIHVDPVEDGEIVRFRVDGIIHEKDRLTGLEGHRLLNQIKISAGLTFDKCFAPEEGMIVFDDEEGSHDIRVTVAPITGREAIHFRFLSTTGWIQRLADLGLCEQDVAVISDALQARTGLVLVGGITASGKTTTLYALASALDLATAVTVSIEDPVEFRVPYIRQIQVDPGHGVSMREGLRTLLRMDPDAIIIGEIRDQHSAVTAGRAALAGQLVLATVHAPDPLTAVSALTNLSVPEYVVGGALRLIVTQDLIRRLCPACTRPVPLDDEAGALFDRYGVDRPAQTMQPVGCRKCGQYGYFGRVGAFQVTRIDADLGHDIAAGADRRHLEERFRAASTRSQMTDALTKAADGVTSMEEVMRLHASRRD